MVYFPEASPLQTNPVPRVLNAPWQMLHFPGQNRKVVKQRHRGALGSAGTAQASGEELTPSSRAKHLSGVILAPKPTMSSLPPEIPDPAPGPSSSRK